MKSNKLGIDLGTVNTLIFIKNKGIIINEPSVVAINLINQSIIAVGKKAKEMFGKTPDKIKVIKPMKNGVIADFDTTKEMLKYFMNKTGELSTFKKLHVIISIPFCTTNIEKRAVIEAALQAGAKNAYLIEEPLAAAIGAGLPVEEPTGSMIVNIGGGTSEIAVISLGGLVIGRSIRAGGNILDETIQNHMRKKYRLIVGLNASEKLKIEIGSALKNIENNTSYKISGIDLKTGLPKIIEIPDYEITETIQEPLKELVSNIKEVFEHTPPQLTSDIIKNGITLTGGGAKLKKIDELIESQTKISVKIAENPQECVALGTGKTICSINNLVNMTLYHI